MPAELVYTQDSFAGGMNLLSLDTKIEPNQYRVGINIRSRFGYIRPIKTPIDITDGLGVVLNLQGLYAFGDILVCFRDGLAYYRNLTTNVWTQISGFLMDDQVDRIYCCAVPQASLVYNRVNAGATPSAGVTLSNTTTTGSPLCLVVQDGINQPFLIFQDGTCRAAKTYAQWSVTDREYIPVGRQMVHFNGILFVVSADGKYVYRSVSGRPLDFVVAVDNAANKVANAEVTSFAVDSNEIKVLAQLNADSLVVITAYAAYSVTLDFSDRLYDEPTFYQNLLFTAGAVNQFSFADILGDFAFIDKEGLRSFNAVLQLRNEGNNSIFSLTVAELFRGHTQDNPCIGSFDNYTFFSVRTTYGAASVLVYDNIQKIFVSVDTLTTDPFKQFATTYTASEQRFFGATRNKVYELYTEDSETYQTALLITRSFDSRNTDFGPTKVITQIKSETLRMLFKSVDTEAGQVNMNQLIDDRLDPVDYTYSLVPYTSEVPYPVGAPVIATLTNAINNVSLQPRGAMGEKLFFVLLWTKGYILTQIQLTAVSNMDVTSAQQQGRVYSS